MVPFIACVFLLSTCIDRCSAVLSSQQTVPPGGGAVCPHSTVEFTCKADHQLNWRDLNALSGPRAQPATYSITIEVINQTKMAGEFKTVLTDISGNTLTSTATIESVSLNDNRRRLACFEVTPSLVITQQDHIIHIKSSPPAPFNVSIAADMVVNTVSQAINLTWSLDNQLCVVMYHVEVTNTNIGVITSESTKSQYIVLTLQTGVVYSVRVRGADSAGRGEWSEPFLFGTTPAPPTSPTSPTPELSLPTPPNPALIPIIVGAAVAGVFLLMLVSCLLFTLIIAIVALLLCKKSTKNTDHMQHSADTHKAADVSRNPAYSITSNEPVKVQNI